jgi:hypothetical protein
MASGHVNRVNRPNTWPHRPSCKREKKPLPMGSRPHMALFGPAAGAGETSASRRKTDIPCIVIPRETTGIFAVMKCK